MSIIKSLSVGNGDMFYIKHDSDNFTIIDCCMDENNQKRITDEIEKESQGKGIIRFISTHPDDDHYRGLVYLDDRLGIRNFYCVKNQAVKDDETNDFKRYCLLRDGDHHFYISRDCTRRWINLANEDRGESGINVLWPITDNEHFVKVLHSAAQDGTDVNNLSPILLYRESHGMKIMWMGDMETDFLEKIKNEITWPKIDVLFAPHHGRQSGTIPADVLNQLAPHIIVVGEGSSGYLNYYRNHNTITQNSAWDIVFVDNKNIVHIYVSNPQYAISRPDFLFDGDISGHHPSYGYYLGSFKPHWA